MHVPGLEGLLDLILPLRCEVCGADGVESPLCASCRARISVLPERLCGRCGVPMQPGSYRSCAGCRLVPPHFAQARAVAPYEGVLRTAIHRFKYSGVQGLAAPLSELLVARDPYGPRPEERIVAVPLGRHRRSRGFNQAALLARRYGRALGIPVVLGVLEHRGGAGAQAGADRASRLENARGAYRVRRPGRVVGRALVLVDDVITTGATVDSCAAALLDSGASRVRVLALARTLEEGGFP